MDKARIILSKERRGERATGHRHQRIDRHQPADLVDSLGAHDIEAEPASNRVYNHGTCKVVELLAKRTLHPGLNAKALVPGNAFKKRIHQPDQNRSGEQLRAEAGALRNPSRHDRRNRRRKSQEEKELHQFISVLLRQRFCSHHEAIENYVTVRH